MNRLKGKVCFVTGAGQGIGRSVADCFAREGATVIAADLRFPPHFDFAANITQHNLDVTDQGAVLAAAAQHRDVDVLVNCVGYVAAGDALQCSMDDFDLTMNVNVRSMALTIRSFLPSMLDRRNGAIVNFASVVSSVRAAPGRFAYAASKAAVIGLTMAVARDFIDSGIRCNSISPGTVETPSLHERWEATGDAEAARSAFVSRQPMGRLGEAHEIAAAAILLASDEARFMTGSNIIIDGGMSL